ncbi:MAG: hypothetical protein ACI83O_000611 [Patescibacteria group bacterium]|jgi:hypothetical protein
MTATLTLTSEDALRSLWNDNAYKYDLPVAEGSRFHIADKTILYSLFDETLPPISPRGLFDSSASERFTEYFDARHNYIFHGVVRDGHGNLYESKETGELPKLKEGKYADFRRLHRGNTDISDTADLSFLMGWFGAEFTDLQKAEKHFLKLHSSLVTGKRN